MNILPNLKISQGEAFAYDVTVVGQNWTGYTGAATFKKSPKAADTILTVPVTGDSAGLLQMGLSAAETEQLPALPRLGWNRTCVCEIAMESAVTGDVQRFQAWVSVAAKI